jgi:FkbM family methyltransferase
MQSFLTQLYGHLHGDAIRRSPAGRWLFERSYDAYKRFLEAGPVNRLGDYIRPDTWVVDVGANIGFFTIGFARFLSGSGRVIAVEPEAQNFSALQRRIGLAHVGDRVIARHAAAADQSGVLRLQLNPNHPGDHRLAPDGIPIAAVTLDGLIRECHASSVSLVKIDVQGAELKVLKGAAELLARDRPVLFVEIDDSALRGQGSSAIELLTWLGARDYLPHRLRRRGKPVPLMPEYFISESGYVDALFLPRHQPSQGVDREPE